MRWFSAVAVAGVAIAVLAVADASPARADMIAEVGAAGDPRAAFGILNCDAPGAISVATDGSRGAVWRFRKPAASNRCEAHSFKSGGGMYATRNNATYYFAWSMKLSSTVDNNAVFQWKSYGDHIQNFPVVLSVHGNDLTVFNRQPNKEDHTPWRTPIKAGTWYDIVLGIHTSDELLGGWVELYLNGRQQTFTNGAYRWPCRTWDSRNDPKWGVYGAQGTDVDSYVDDLRIATTLADVLPPSATASPTRSVSPSPSASPSASGSPSASPTGAQSPPAGISQPSVPVAAVRSPAAAGTRPGLPAGAVWVSVGVVVVAPAVVAVFLLRARPRRRHRGRRQ